MLRLKMRKTLVAIIIVFLISLLLIGGTLLYVVYDFVKCFEFTDSRGEMRTVKEMVELFNGSYDKLHELNLEMIEFRKMGLKSIAYSWSEPDNLSDIGISRKYRKELMNRMEELSIPEGVRCRKDGIMYISYAYGLLGLGYIEGYYFSLVEPINYYSNPEGKRKEPFEDYKELETLPTGSYVVYLKVSDNWYIIKQFLD